MRWTRGGRAGAGGDPLASCERLEQTTMTDGTFARRWRTGGVVRTDDEEGGEDVGRGSAHGGSGPFAARDPEERLLEGSLAFLHLPRIRPARRRGELGEEVEERALIGSRAGVDPRGRERADGARPTPIWTTSPSRTSSPRSAPGARARPPVRTSPRPRCLPRCHQPTSRRRRRSMMIPRADARGSARGCDYFGQHNEGHSHALPAPASLLLLLTRRARGPGPRRGCRPRPFRAARRWPGRRPPARRLSRATCSCGVPPRTGSRGSDPCPCRSSPGTSATSPARRARPSPGSRRAQTRRETHRAGAPVRGGGRPRRAERRRQGAPRRVRRIRATRLLDPATGPSAAERAARAALLQSNPELAALHGRLVRGSPHASASAADPSDPSDPSSSAAVTDEEFWSARTHLFRDAVAKAGATQRPGLANALDADVKGARDGRGDVVTATLSNEKMHRIFSEQAGGARRVSRKRPEKDDGARILDAVPQVRVFQSGARGRRRRARKKPRTSRSSRANRRRARRAERRRRPSRRR